MNLAVLAKEKAEVCVEAVEEIWETITLNTRTAQPGCCCSICCGRCWSVWVVVVVPPPVSVAV